MLLPVLQGALLCDSAKEYQGLVSILGGFVSIVNVRQFPAVSPIWFAGRVAFLEEEIAQVHEVRVLASNDEGETLAELTAEIPPNVMHVRHGVLPGINLVHPLPFDIVAEGMYWVEMSVDGNLLVRLPLRAVPLATP